jgi:hypothetical protein
MTEIKFKKDVDQCKCSCADYETRINRETKLITVSRVNPLDRSPC